MMKLRFAESPVKGSKRRALKKFLAALSELTEWLINGKNISVVQIRSSHDWRTETGALIHKASLGLLSMQQAGLQAVDS